jgi:hypothetical protein
MMLSEVASDAQAYHLTGPTAFLRTATQFRYRAAPVFAAPPCPVELGADCVVAGAGACPFYRASVQRIK